MSPEYQQSIADHGFQPELPSEPTKPEGSSVAKFFKVLIIVILSIGGIIMLLPVIEIIFCLLLIAVARASLLPLPLLNSMSIGTLFFTGFTLLDNKRISKKYIPVLIFAMVFSLLFFAGQYQVEEVCSPYLKFQVTNLFMPLTQLCVSIMGLLAFCYNESFFKKIKLKK